MATVPEGRDQLRLASNYNSRDEEAQVLRREVTSQQAHSLNQSILELSKLSKIWGTPSEMVLYIPTSVRIKFGALICRITI